MSAQVPSVGASGERPVASGGCPAGIEAEGWTRRFTAIGPRLSEAVDLYRALGYELLLEPADPGEAGLSDEACAQCLVMTLARTIYTRRPVVASGERRARRGETERVTA